MRRGGSAVALVVFLGAILPGGLNPHLLAQDVGSTAADGRSPTSGSPPDGTGGADGPGEAVVDPQAAIIAALGGGPLSEDGEETRRYRSNAEYIALEPTDMRTDGYVLVVADGDGDRSFAERSILFLDGIPVGGERLDRDDRGRITARLRVDDRGETLLTEEILYRGDDTIRAVTLCREGACITARFAPPGPFGDETIVGEDGAVRFRFDGNARPEYIRTERNGTLVEEFFVYREGVLVERRRVTDDGASTTTTYREGRVVREVDLRSGRVVRTTEFTYDPEGRTLRRTEESRTERREWEWVYDADDGSYLLRERANGDLVSQERVRPDGQIERTLFRDGVAVLRETIVDDEVVDRQVLGGVR